MSRARFVKSANADANIDALSKVFMETKVLPQMVEYAKRVVPVDSGDLQRAIHQETEGNQYYLVADTEYALFVEQGTSKMAAQPYLRPAMSIKIRA